MADEGLINISDNVSVTSKADITSTADISYNKTIQFNSTGTLTVSSGTVTGSGSYVTIYNDSSGTLNIDGGVVQNSRKGYAVSAINRITFVNGNVSNGGAIYNTGGNLTVTDCIFRDNTATAYGGALEAGSPAIDAGNNSFNTAVADLAGNARVAGGTIDIGAYEYGSAPPAYTVAVTDGTGGGDFEAGVTVTVTATVPGGKRFVSWTFVPAVTFVDGTSAASEVAKFAMPAGAVIATAAFEPVVVPPVTYTLTVEDGGRGSGVYLPGDTVIITSGLAPKGKRFAGWSSDDADVMFTETKSGKTTFVMPASDVTVVAAFADYVVPKFVVSSASKAAGSVSVFMSGDPVAKASLAIFDATGNLVRKVSVSDDAEADAEVKRNVAVWDLKDSKGRPVSSGTYLLRGAVKTVDGNVSKVSVPALTPTLSRFPFNFLRYF